MIKWVVIGLLVVCVGVSVYNETSNTRYECVEKAKVLDILRVHYRSATILTDKGEIVLNQSSVADGDYICLRTERVTID